jgi:hypothetical protein
MKHLLPSLAIAVTWAIVSPASAQCAEGRVVSESTAGRCCWPAQHWNAEAGRCEGPPSCPAGRVAAGDDCALAAPVASPAIVPVHAPYAGPLAPELRTRTTFDEGLVIAGTTTLVVGYVYSLIVGGVFFGGAGYMAFIPVIGGFLWLIPFLPYGLYFGIAGSVVQTVGLITLIVGLVQRVEVYAGGDRPHRAGGGPTITPGPGEAGLGLRWDF